MSEVWRKCSVCKTDIAIGSPYYVCSISSCRKSVFCSDKCWDVHNGVLGHKSAWAEENIAVQTELESPRRLMAKSHSADSDKDNDSLADDVLIVASKLKHYVKVKHGLNTSANVFDILSRIVRVLTDEAVGRANVEGRKTLMDRDFLE